MLRLRSLGVGILLAGVLLCLSSAATAQPVNVYLPFSGNVYVGMTNGGAYVEVCQSSSPPTSWRHAIGNSAGLDHIYAIFAANGNDNFGVVSSTVTNLCGHTFTPLVYHGHWVYLYGGDGNDIVGGGSTTSPNNIVKGGPGGDWIWSAPGGAADGEAGGDFVMGWGMNSSTAGMYGGTDDASVDYVCEYDDSILIYEMDGGPGWDIHCGWGSHFTNNLEEDNCTACWG